MPRDNENGWVWKKSKPLPTSQSYHRHVWSQTSFWLSAYHLIVDDFDLFEDFPSFIRFRHNFGLPLAISSTSSVSSASFLFSGKSDCISDR